MHADGQPAVLRSGDRVLIRPIRPEDREDLLDGLHRMTPESRYRRFFSPMPELSARELRYLTEVDHRTHEALVAIDPGTDKGIGEARFIRSTTDPTTAEVAVAVLDDWQGRGVATALIEALSSRGREEGVTCFTASVLAGNAPMLELLRNLGGTSVVDRSAGVVEIRMELGDAGVPAGLTHTVRAVARGEATGEPQHPAASP
jgi:RimJ/RimL family protein N-acetyltransferase